MANVVALFLAGIGLYGAAKIKLYCVGAHGLLTVSVLGTFFGFCMLELLFFPGSNDIRLMVVMTIPYAVDLIVGCSSVLLYAKMKEALSREFPPTDSVDPTQPLLLQPGEMCSVCQNQKNTCAFYPCGHKCVCRACAGRLVRMGCPICRKPIRDYIVIYD